MSKPRDVSGCVEDWGTWKLRSVTMALVSVLCNPFSIRHPVREEAAGGISWMRALGFSVLWAESIMAESSQPSWLLTQPLAQDNQSQLYGSGQREWGYWTNESVTTGTTLSVCMYPASPPPIQDCLRTQLGVLSVISIWLLFFSCLPSCSASS